MWHFLCCIALLVAIVCVLPLVPNGEARTARNKQNPAANASISAPLLALPGPLFASSLPNDSTSSTHPYPHPYHLHIRGRPLLYDPSASAAASSPASHAINTARHAWDAGFVLSKLIESYNVADGSDNPSPLPARCEGESSAAAESHHRWLSSELRLDATSVVVELGAGAHMLPSLSAWRLGAGSVTATDVQEMTSAMQQIADINTQFAAESDHQPPPGRLRVAAVNWTEQNERLLPIDPLPTQLLASDVVWLRELVGGLVHTIAALLSHSRPPAVLYLAHQHRSEAGWQLFEGEAERADLIVQPLHRCLQPEGYRSDKVDVYRLVQRAQ